MEQLQNRQETDLNSTKCDQGGNSVKPTVTYFKIELPGGSYKI